MIWLHRAELSRACYGCGTATMLRSPRVHVRHWHWWVMWTQSADVEFEYFALMAAERSMYSRYSCVISVTVSLSKAVLEFN